eukprot:GFUD01031836.1.p1 GENE.GFUD01031836.1~~GFUD01031836.1.p1  ORF type:complete len:400 (+),score=146.66 GFUD01031836.1:1424-2623(+)
MVDSFFGDEDAFGREPFALKSPFSDGGGGGGGGKGGSKKGKGKKGVVKMETLPSASGIRVVPMIAEELKLKTAKIIAAKERKATKGEKVKTDKGVKAEKDEFDMMADTKSGLSDSAKKMKQSKIDFKPKKEVPESKKGNPWSDSDGSEESEDLSGSDIDGDVVDIAPRERARGRRNTANPTTYIVDDSGSAASDSDHGMKNRKDDSSGSEMDTAPVKQISSTRPSNVKKRVLDSSEGEDAAAGKDEFDISDSGSDGGFARKVAAQTKKPPPKKLNKESDLFSGMMAGGGEPKKTAAKKAAAKKPTVAGGAKKPTAVGGAKKLPAPSKKTVAPASKKKHSGSEDDKPAKKAKSVKKSQMDSESGSDFDDGPAPPPREKAGGRSRAPVSYQGLDEESDSDF